LHRFDDLHFFQVEKHTLLPNAAESENHRGKPSKIFTEAEGRHPHPLHH